MTESGVLRRIEWRELFPWLILLRVFRVAITPGPVGLATLAVLVTMLGWWLSSAMFLEEDIAKRFPVRPAPLEIPEAAAAYMPSGYHGVLGPVIGLVQPVNEMLRYNLPPRYVAYYLFGWLIAVVAWTFVGGVITRQALIELGVEQPYDWFDAIRFVCGRYSQYLLAPLAPLLALVCMGLLVVPLGWLMNWGFGVFIAGLLWIFVVLLGLVAAWLLVGLLFGWPLMIAAVGAKRDGDALQAFSDAFSYVYGKPLYLFFYTIVALVIGALGMAAIELFRVFAVEFGFWAASWGAGVDDIAPLRQQVAFVELGQGLPETVRGGQRGGVYLIAAVLSLTKAIVTGAALSYFFTAAAGIYLLMRLAVDEKEMDEVHLEDEDVHLETARRAMLSDETVPEKRPPTPEPTDTVAVDTATTPPVPPPVVTTADSESLLPPPGEPTTDKPAE